MVSEKQKPLLPLRDIVIFPSTVIPLFVGRKKSIKALEEQQTKEAVKKYGSKDSGGVLGEILGPLIKKKEKSKK